MLLTEQIETVTKWIDQKVCKNLEMLLPGGEDRKEPYQYHRDNPACFSVFVPAKDKLPPDVSGPIPSFCVQPNGGELQGDKQTLGFRISAAAWSKGLYKDGVWLQNANGWKDAWLMIDKLLDALQKTDNVGGLAIDRDENIKFGAYKDNESEALADYYPYFFGWVTFRLYTRRVVPTESFENFL